ncbi:MAG: metallophosphoesterase [Candidatus Aenigmarchaeota archaeon]|nr:metallophosphoesterase [Candidatus Aenigmarchaeota archaeon]
MKILVLTDIHGKHEAVSKLLAGIKTDYDMVLCAGDLTDMYDIPQGFSQMNIADLVIQKLAAQGKPVLCIPGNHDPFEILELFDDYGINLHGKHRKVLRVNFVGFGGASTPFNTLFEPTEEEIVGGLRKSAKTGEDFVLVVHMPPKDTKTDLITEGKHVGSRAIRDFILESRPVAAVSGHIHESQAIDRLGKTQLINPGPAFQGNYGIIEIKGGEAACEIRKAKTT